MTYCNLLRFVGDTSLSRDTIGASKAIDKIKANI